MAGHDFEVRKAIYEQIEAERASKVINYVTGDRPNMHTQIVSRCGCKAKPFCTTLKTLLKRVEVNGAHFVRRSKAP